MRRILLFLGVMGLLVGCSGGESGTVGPEVRQMRAGLRGRHR